MVTEPKSMDDLIYFTRRIIGTGKAKAWVYKKECPECHKEKMGKPVEKGHVKIRAKEYVCPGCGFVEEKAEHEGKLVLEVQYTCPHCEKEGVGTTEYKLKTFEGVKSYVVICEHCGGKIAITKKMKEGKKKK